MKTFPEYQPMCLGCWHQASRTLSYCLGPVSHESSCSSVDIIALRYSCSYDPPGRVSAQALGKVPGSLSPITSHIVLLGASSTADQLSQSWFLPLPYPHVSIWSQPETEHFWPPDLCLLTLDLADQPDLWVPWFSNWIYPVQIHCGAWPISVVLVLSL